MSDMQLSSKKRNASAADVGSSDNQLVTKKRKLATALDNRLTELKHAVIGFTVAWEPYDPGNFMTDIGALRDEIDGLTPEKIGVYIENLLSSHSFVLVHYEKVLKELPTPTDELAKLAHKTMLDFVTDIRARLNALVDQARSKPSPSEFADHEQWPVYQQRPDAILCLRPADKKGLPIPLMHVAFCNFTRHFHEPILDEHTPKYLTMADKLCQTMPSAFESEGDRRDAFKSIFLSLGKDLRQNTEFSLSVKVSAAEESGTRPDVANTIGHEGGHLVLLLGEFEVESTGDIYMQTCRSYEVLCEEPKNERLLRFGNPVFLLCVLGPYLMVCGAIKHENVHVEPLTPLLPMFPEFSIQGRSGQLAHCLRALREGLDALREFWQVAGVLEGTNKKASSDKLPELYLVPQCPDNGLLRFGEWQGTFESPMHERRNSDKPPCFFANLRKTGDECPRQVVVKFVYSYSGTYGTAVHRYLHSLGLAPFLYTVETLHRGLVMVVMDHLASEKGTEHWVELDTFEGKLGDRADKVRKRLGRIVDHLQAKKMVHVDLRPKNIMIKVDGNGDIIISEQEPILSVIDFDWAGTVDEVLYPPFLNPKVPWPPGAKAYQKVGENHDRILLNNWWAEFVKDSPAK